MTIDDFVRHGQFFAEDPARVCSTTFNAKHDLEKETFPFFAGWKPQHKINEVFGHRVSFVEWSSVDPRIHQFSDGIERRTPEPEEFGDNKAITDAPLSEVVRGAFPYVLSMLLGIVVLLMVPGLATWLPYTAGFGR